VFQRNAPPVIFDFQVQKNFAKFAERVVTEIAANLWSQSTLGVLRAITSADDFRKNRGTVSVVSSGISNASACEG
jgi:hypothetical protein